MSFELRQAKQNKFKNSELKFPIDCKIIFLSLKNNILNTDCSKYFLLFVLRLTIYIQYGQMS